MTTDEKFDLFMKHKQLILEIVHEYFKRDYRLEELINAGTEGLMKAVLEFSNEDINNNINFNVFATFHIKSAINEYLQTGE
jgi:DNA-directed RNA polymerase sigma subunit (sigma70/sigma32)